MSSVVHRVGEWVGALPWQGPAYVLLSEIGYKNFSISYKLETTDLTQLTTDILPRRRMVGGICFR